MTPTVESADYSVRESTMEENAESFLRQKCKARTVVELCDPGSESRLLVRGSRTRRAKTTINGMGEKKLKKNVLKKTGKKKNLL